MSSCCYGGTIGDTPDLNRFFQPTLKEEIRCWVHVNTIEIQHIYIYTWKKLIERRDFFWNENIKTSDSVWFLNYCKNYGKWWSDTWSLKHLLYFVLTVYMQIKNVPIYIYISMYIYIYGYIHSDNTSMMITHTHTHLGCLILTTSGLKRSCGSFSSCNPCRWMLRSCKCWRIQENILGGSMEERKKIRGTQRPVFCWEVGKNPWVPKKICGSTPTWFLFLFFDRHHVFFSAGEGVIYHSPYLHWKRFHHVQLPTQSSQFVMPKLHGSRRGPFLSSFSCVQQPSDLISS